MSKLHVEFADGDSAVTMTARELCGWARTHKARVVTDDFWPVVNGIIQSFGAEAKQSGRVAIADGTCVAYWEAQGKAISSTQVPAPS